ncbi:MAG: cytochrome c oxidase subunit I, partial [Thermomicrobiales bacterium]
MTVELTGQEGLRPRARTPGDVLLLRWLATVDHKQIGIMYLMGAVFFFLIGGVEALLIRIQLAQPNATVLSPEVYNQIFTMHGTTMIFLAVMPLLAGFVNYFVPLMIGANDMAFPRLNAFSLWLFIFGGLLLNFSFLTGHAPDIGWFAYAPLTEQPYALSNGVNYWILGPLVASVGTILTALNVIVTILTMRAPGMTLTKVPLFVWMSLGQAILIIYAFPPLTASQAMLLLDRELGAHFFDPAAGGSPVLFQHLFCFFCHPKVYIIILPDWGMIYEMIPIFSLKPIIWYP